MYKNCITCNNAFEIPKIKHGADKIYCSPKCGSKFRYIKEKNKKPNCFCSLCCKPLTRRGDRIKNSRSKLFFCSRDHEGIFYSDKNNKEKLPKHFFTKKKENLHGDGIRSRVHRKIAFKEYKLPKIGNRCNITDYRVIIVHHKDRNRTNNDISNLEILCANCHFIEHYKPKAKPDTRKIKIFKQNNSKCARCDWIDFRAIVIHHKDRNKHNNIITNLETICANCHAIEHSIRK